MNDVSVARGNYSNELLPVQTYLPHHGCPVFDQNGLWRSHNKGHCGCGDFYFNESDSAHCGQHGVPIPHKQSRLSRKKTSLKTFILNLSGGSGGTASARTKRASPLSPNSSFSSSQTKQQQQSSSSSLLMRIRSSKFFRAKNDNPTKAVECGATVMMEDKKKRRPSRNSSFCPFSPSVSSSDEEVDNSHPFDDMLRAIRDFRSRVRRSEPPDTEGESSQPSAAPGEVMVASVTEALANPAIGTPTERAIFAVHSTVEYTNVLVPDLQSITGASYYWGEMDRYEAEALLDGKAEGTFLLRDSAQINYLFSVSFRRYQRTLHARIEHQNGVYSFDLLDDAYHRANQIRDLVEKYKDPQQCLFYEPQLSSPLPRNFVFDLKHLCRATICSNTRYDKVSELPLPPVLKKYLREYHYKQPVRVTDHDV